MQRYVPCQGFAETKYQGLVGQLGLTVSCIPAEISVHSEPAIFIPIMRVQGEAYSVDHILVGSMIMINLKVIQLYRCKSHYEQSNLFANVP